MQTIQIVGYLGRDAEIRSFTGNDNSEQKVLTFSVGVTRRYKDKEQTTWYYCTRSYREGGKLAEWLTKGRRVLVRGELTAKVYVPDNKEAQVSLSVACDKIFFLDNKQQEQPTSEAIPTVPADLENKLLNDLSQNYNSDADDLPF